MTIVLLLLLTPAVEAQDPTCPCGQNLRCYQDQGYKVREIRLETLFEKNVPLKFIFAIQNLLATQFAQIKPQLSLKEGQPFTVDGFNNAPADFSKALGSSPPGQRFRFVYLEHSLEGCDPRNLTIDVVHKMLITDGLSFLTSRFEDPKDKISRTVLIPIPHADRNKVLPQPSVGYNRSRGLFGGGHVSFKRDGGIFEKVELDASGSGSSGTIDFAVSGSRSFSEGIVNHAEWKLGYKYSDVPADLIRLKGATGDAQFFAGSRPLGSRGMSLRFGATLEAGNRQTDLALNAGSIPANLQRTPYGAVKVYAGSTMNWGRQAWTASYGLQLGQAGRAIHVDYVKQIFDTAYSIRLLPREHAPLKLDTQFTAGLITSSSKQIPIGERFFGGNTQTNFIQGDDWHFNSTPLIRSFPQYRLNLIGPGMPIGGTKFFSANLTLSQTVWSRPTVPDEVSNLAALRIGLGSQITSERRTAVGSYLRVAPAFIDLLNELTLLGDELKKLEARLDNLKTSQPPEPVLTAIGSLFLLDDDSGYIPLPNAKETMEDALKDKVVTTSLATALAKDTPIESILSVVDRKLLNLQTSLDEARISHAEIDDSKTKLATIKDALLTKIDIINTAPNYNSEDVQRVISQVNKLTPVLTAIQEQADLLPPAANNDQVKDYGPGVDNLKSYLEAAQDAVSAVSEDETDTWQAEKLVLGYGKVSPAFITGLVESIDKLQVPLKAKGLETEAQTLRVAAKSLVSIQVQITTEIKKVKVPKIVRLANRDIAFTGRVLDVIFRELNLVALSPVAMFDVARIGPQSSQGYGGLRYGVGGGVRFSLVTLDLTCGYALNPHRHPNEGRGAFVFSMTISDLFR